MSTVWYYTSVEQIPALSSSEKLELRPVTTRFTFRANSYYLSLIDWSDPFDPIRRIVIPTLDELEDWGSLDASSESTYTVVPGLEHKYLHTAMLLVSGVCGGYCRFCFRKRVFMPGATDVAPDPSAAIDYICRHTEIDNVLLSGGDPLALSSNRLRSLFTRLREIEHVRAIRIGSKLVAFDPRRIADDPSLLALLREHSHDDRKVYVMTQFNHPRELTPEALRAIDSLQAAGVCLSNQTPVLAGVNDDDAILGELFDRLAGAGVPPYYVFICRPTLGNHSFAVPVERALSLFEQARAGGSGLTNRARLVMSHRTGKIEVVGTLGETVLFRYHRAAHEENRDGRLFTRRSDPSALWFDDYEPQVGDGSDRDVARGRMTAPVRRLATTWNRSAARRT